jgi:hypothetical protein
VAVGGSGGPDLVEDRGWSDVTHPGGGAGDERNA